MTTEQDRAAGWFEDPYAPGDAARRRWWDGAQWTVGSRWDGAAWVVEDAAAAGDGAVTSGDGVASAGTRRSGRGWIWAVVAVLALGLAGWGAVLFVADRWDAADSNVDHQGERSTGESPTITEQLVEVPGYGYRDVSDAEIQAALDRLREAERDAGIPEGEGYTAVSLHAVVADDDSQNTATGSVGSEVGFLQLYEFADAIPAAESEEPPGGGGKLVDDFDVGDVHVNVFEDPSSSDSRFTYAWVRHGVLVAFDGATREETQRWVEAYVAEPVRLGTENQALGDAIVPVDGYAYTNTTIRTADLAMFVTDPIGDVPFSYHVVTDERRTIGKLLLVDPADGFDSATLGAAELASLNTALSGFTSLGTTDLAGVPVEHLQGPDGDVFLWSRDGLVGIYVTSETLDAAQPFLTAYLAAR